MASYRPIDDLALARLYKAVGGALPYDTPVSEAMVERQEVERLKSVILREIQDFKETEKLTKLAHAIGLAPRGLPAPTDRQLLRLYNAVR